MRFTKITIIRSSRPERKDINKELQWFGGSIGLFNLRDKDKSCFRVFITLLKAVRENKQLSSDEIAKITGLSRGTVVFHLNKLMGSGVVINEHNKYFLRMESLEDVVEHMRRDVEDVMKTLSEIAKDIDGQLGLRLK